MNDYSSLKDNIIKVKRKILITIGVVQNWFKFKL